ncbi:MAG: hypothetical protein HZA82_03390 [Thaumarchaeota archaeon]|nr:hypothetical protein [Nitrososphaerota archaeon]
MDPFLENIIIATAIGIPVGIITGILVKKYSKSKQEIIYEQNRKQIINMLLGQIAIPFAQMSQILTLFTRKEQFVVNKWESYQFTDNEYKALESYRKSIYKILNEFPRFHDCSTFVSSHEYLVIKKYIMSSLFFGPIDGSAVGLKNQAWYDYKVLVDHALFAKEIIECFSSYNLRSDFIDEWTETLSNEGMLSPYYKKERRVPGDLVPPYFFDGELLQ